MNDVRMAGVWTVADEGTPASRPRTWARPLTSSIVLANVAFPTTTDLSTQSVTPLASGTVSNRAIAEDLADVLGLVAAEGTDLISRIQVVTHSNAIGVTLVSESRDVVNAGLRLMGEATKCSFILFESSDRELYAGSVTPVLELPEPQDDMFVPAIDSPVQAVAQLRKWFGLTYDQISAATGVSTGAFFYWKRKAGSPYEKTSRPLWRFYTFAEALVRQLGSRGAKAWLIDGSPSALDLLLGGDLAAAENRAQQQLFQRQEMQASRRVVDVDEAPATAEAEESEGAFAPRRRRDAIVRGRRQLFDEE